MTRLRVIVLPLLCVLATSTGLATPALAVVTELEQEVAEKTEEEAREIGRWYPGLDWGLNLLQTSYTKNWSGGDKSSVSWSTKFIGTLENQFHTDWNWMNRLKLAFGQQHLQDDDRNWLKPEKTDDEIDFESLLRWQRYSPWDPYVSFRFLSQFVDQRDPYGRDLYLNPLDFRESIGISRMFIGKETNFLLFRFGFMARQLSRRTFLSDDPHDETTERATSDDYGLELRVDYRTPILSSRVDWLSRLTVYQPLWYSGSDELDRITDADRDTYGLDDDISDYATVVNVDWENTFTTKITKVIAIRLELRWIYEKYDNSVLPLFDDDGNLENGGAVAGAVRKGGQFKELLSLGLVWTI